MAIVRRRLLFWLIKAYIKKSGKILALSFILGLIIFIALIYGSRYLHNFISVSKKVSIGLVGSYTQDTLPPYVMNKLSQGLTTVDENGQVKPAIASSWNVSDAGKTYTFYIKPDAYFLNGKPITAETINYNFADVEIERPDKKTIVFKLKDPYAPFLISASKHIFDKGFVGLGEYRIEDLKLNGNFVQSLTLVSRQNRFDVIHYQFYPSEEALKMAYMMGEVTRAEGITAPTFKERNFSDFPNTKVEEVTNYSRLVTLFFNTQDGTLSDKKFRLALTYAMPKTYTNGQKAFLPYSPNSPFYNKQLPEREQDFAHTKELLGSEQNASGSAARTVTITTLKKYRPAAEEIAKTWREIGVETKIEETETVPTQFQAFLGDFTIPRDPDQYSLWHSDQGNNISRYKNLRIDKLLEDGRKITNVDERKRIYADFQKYLMDDAPASFLYFPTEYQIVRK